MRKLHLTAFLLLIIATVTLGCGGGDKSPVTSDPGDTGQLVVGPPSDLVVEGRSLMMAFMVDCDFETGEISMEPLRTAATHFDIRPVLTSPWFCPSRNCIKLEFIEIDPLNGYFKIKATLLNPSTLVGHDVRGIVYDDEGTNHELLNPDNYTKLWAPMGFEGVYPFKAFAKTDPERAIHALASNFEIYEFQFDPLPPSWRFAYAVDCSWPDNCEEVYEISEITQVGGLYTTHGCIKLSCRVKHHSGPAHVSNVILDTREFLGEETEMEYNLDMDLWETHIMDDGLNLSAGFFDVLITAESPGVEIALYDFFEIDVIPGDQEEQVSGYVYDEDTSTGIPLALMTTSDGTDLYMDETDYCGFFSTGDVPEGSRVLSFAEPGYYSTHVLTVVQDEPIVIEEWLIPNPDPMPDLPVINMNQPNINIITGVVEISGTIENMDCQTNQSGVYVHQGLEYLMSVDMGMGQFFQGVILGYGDNEIVVRATNAAGTVMSEKILVPYYPEWNFRVTLTWDTDLSDLDLHMWEPPDFTEHCSYEEEITANLMLDYDNVDGYGPENMTPTTDTYPSGVWPIAVDFYDDDGVPYTTAYITLRLNVGTPDEEIAQFSYLLTVPDGNFDYPVQYSTESWWRPCDLVIEPSGLITWQVADTSLQLHN